MQTLSYLERLVAFESTSNLSNVPVSDFVENELKSIGFETERVECFDAAGVRKLSIVARKGRGTAGVGLFAHTDVVPADDWFSHEHGPFEATVVDDRVYGRGTCDMKGSLACMLTAADRFSVDRLQHPLYITCTADEEVGYGGARAVVAESKLFREMVEHQPRAIIGEPTMLDVVYAHKGTYGFKAVSRGRAAHSSSSDGINANLKMIPFLARMKRIHDETLRDPAWRNDEFDPPTISWNIGINDHTRAVNITPPQSVCTVYFRPMPGQNGDELIDRVRQAADECGLELDVRYRGAPLYVDPQSAFIQEMLQLAGRSTPRTVSYGTDGTVFGELKNRVVYGPGDIAQAHTHDEWIALEQLELGTTAFANLIENWCCRS